MPFTTTPSAVRFVARMTRFSGAPEGGFRLVVKPGGCSGFSSEFSVEPAPLAGDQVVEQDGIRLFLPVESRLLLDGAVVDFADTPTESGFVIRHPGKADSCCSTTPAPELVTLGRIG